MFVAAGDLSLWMAPAYNFETIFNFSAHALTSMSFSHNQCAEAVTFVRMRVVMDPADGGC